MSLASVGMETSVGLDQPALHPSLARVALLTRYVGPSVAPPIPAAILWATLKPESFKTLMAEIGE